MPISRRGKIRSNPAIPQFLSSKAYQWALVYPQADAKSGVGRIKDGIVVIVVVGQTNGRVLHKMGLESIDGRCRQGEKNGGRNKERKGERWCQEPLIMFSQLTYIVAVDFNTPVVHFRNGLKLNVIAMGFSELPQGQVLIKVFRDKLGKMIAVLALAGHMARKKKAAKERMG